MGRGHAELDIAGFDQDKTPAGFGYVSIRDFVSSGTLSGY